MAEENLILTIIQYLIGTFFFGMGIGFLSLETVIPKELKVLKYRAFVIGIVFMIIGLIIWIAGWLLIR